MPSTEHDAVADLVTRQPALLVELAALVGVQLPTFDTMAPVDTNLSRMPSLALQADKASVFRAADATPIFALISEVQLKWDDDKLYAWPGYVVSLRQKYRCPALLFVVTLSVSVERRARRPIELGGGNPSCQLRRPQGRRRWDRSGRVPLGTSTSSVIRPIVIGPSVVPKVIEATDGTWELAILSALMHARSEEGPDIAAVAMLGARDHVGEDEQALYFDLISHKLSVVARELLKGKLMDKHYEPLTAFSRHWKRVGVKEGREEGRAEGREEGRAEGREKGRAEGGIERLVQSVLLVLDARGLKLSAAAHAQLAAMRDLEALTDMVRRAALVDSGDALFPDAPVAPAPPAARKARKRR